MQPRAVAAARIEQMGETPGGVEDEATIAFLTDGAAEPVGAAGSAARGADDLMVWSRG